MSKVKVVKASMYKQEPTITVFSADMTTRQIVESLAQDFECLSEKHPKTLAQLNECTGGQVIFSIATEKVHTK